MMIAFFWQANRIGNSGTLQQRKKRQSSIELVLICRFSSSESIQIYPSTRIAKARTKVEGTLILISFLVDYCRHTQKRRTALVCLCVSTSSFTFTLSKDNLANQNKYWIKEEEEEEEGFYSNFFAVTAQHTNENEIITDFHFLLLFYWQTLRHFQQKDA